MQMFCFEINFLKLSKNFFFLLFIGLKIVGIFDDNDEVFVQKINLLGFKVINFYIFLIVDDI